MDEHERMKQLVAKAKEANRIKAENHAKERLCEKIEKKFTTASIGTLERIEELFGDLWGFGVPEDELTDTQKKMIPVWSLLRNNILNFINFQKRAALDELQQHTVTYNKFVTTFKIQDKKLGDKNE